MNHHYSKIYLSILRQLHNLIGSDDIYKTRHFQEELGNLYGANKKYSFSKFKLNNLQAEWVKYNRDISASSVVFYCHGGGYLTGCAAYARGITTKIAYYSHFPVFTFNYRLAPEYPYPAALEDSITAWQYLLSLGYDANNIIVAGDSAGGNLALSLTLYLKEHNYSLPKCLILLSPWTDLVGLGDTYITKSSLDPILTKEYLEYAANLYINNHEASEPYISPIFANLCNFPPVYIQVGENEILLNDSTRLYEKLLADNVPSKLDIYPDMWHIFQMAPLKISHNAIKSIFSIL